MKESTSGDAQTENSSYFDSVCSYLCKGTYVAPFIHILGQQKILFKHWNESKTIKMIPWSYALT
jgi:hypothetical protein